MALCMRWTGFVVSVLLLPVAALPGHTAGESPDAAPGADRTVTELPLVEVVGVTPLPELGLPLNQVPTAVQQATNKQLRQRHADFSSQGNVLDSLTEREFDVLRLFLDERSASEVVQALNLSRNSLANHRWAIKQKAGVDNFMQLLHVAMRMGIAPDGLSTELPSERPPRDERNSDD